MNASAYARFHVTCFSIFSKLGNLQCLFGKPVLQSGVCRYFCFLIPLSVVCLGCHCPCCLRVVKRMDVWEGLHVKWWQYRLQKWYAVNKCMHTYIYRVRQKNVHTLERKKTVCCIIDYCKSTIYFCQYNNMIYVFTSI
jgi:hypothetical protein